MNTSFEDNPRMISPKNEKNYLSENKSFVNVLLTVDFFAGEEWRGNVE